MDAIEMLRNQHERIGDLLHQLVDASLTAKRRKLEFERVADQLAMVASLEERIFYPSVNSDAIEEQLLEALEMSLAIKRVVTNLMHLEDEDSTFRARSLLLRDLVRKHQQQLEQGIFPAVLARVETAQLDELGRDMETMLLDFETRSPRGELPLQIDRPASLDASDHVQGIIAEYHD